MSANDRFSGIKENILSLAGKNEKIKAVIEIGSQTRKCEKADEYSDLDLIIISDISEAFIDDDKILSEVGDIQISFTEATFGGGMERRILFDGNLDVDFILLSPDQFISLMESHFVDVIFARGFSVLYDTMNAADKITVKSGSRLPYEKLTDKEYDNLVNDFWFHTVWAAKKICRGEIWTAKMCIDGYLKRYLMRMVEMYHVCVHGNDFDVWHEGRMVDKWADEEIKSKLAECFDSYDAQGLSSALKNTADLFGFLARTCARTDEYNYPQKAEEYAKSVYGSLLERNDL